MAETRPIQRSTERIDKLPTARRRKVEQRAKTLIAEEMSLRDLRKAAPRDPVTRGARARHQPGERVPNRKARRPADIHTE